MTEKVIATIPKNSREEIRIGLSEYGGHDLANIRVWFNAGDGKMMPSKAGIAFRLNQLADILAALNEVQTEAHRLGLVDKS